jgi:hypothetical protein
MTIHEKLPRVRVCCCCADLRTGALILGVLGLFGVIQSWMRFVEYTIDTLNGKRPNLGFPPEMDKDMEVFYKILPFITFYEAVLASVMCGLLLYGAAKRNIQMLKIYVLVSLFGLGFYAIIIAILAICAGFIHILLTIFIAVFFTIVLGIAFYYIVCVNSYLMELQDEKNRHVPEMDALKQI